MARCKLFLPLINPRQWMSQWNQRNISWPVLIFTTPVKKQRNSNKRTITTLIINTREITHLQTDLLPFPLEGTTFWEKMSGPWGWFPGSLISCKVMAAAFVRREADLKGISLFTTLTGRTWRALRYLQRLAAGTAVRFEIDNLCYRYLALCWLLPSGYLSIFEMI